jgi:hypothetical protein
MKVRVECYSGRKVDERPIKFWIGEQMLFVESILDQWHGPNGPYFRVRADNNKTYVLGHDQPTDDWILESSRSRQT